jgi:hypothetical protein
MSYDISIQPKDSKSVTPRAAVESFIASLPDVRRESNGVFAYGDERRRLFAHIYTGDTATIDSIGVSVPAAFSKSSEQALSLCFQIAEHLDWQVFDEQVGDYLDKSTATEVLPRRWKGQASIGEIFCEQFALHSAWVVVPTLILTVVIAGYILVARGISESKMPLLFCGAAFGLHAVRALIVTIWRKISDDKKRA